jgi:sortase A
MGTLDIPAIGIKQLPFFHGTSYKTLDRDLGHFEPTSIPIGGINTRSVISGHSGLKIKCSLLILKN